MVSIKIMMYLLNLGIVILEKFIGIEWRVFMKKLVSSVLCMCLLVPALSVSAANEAKESQSTVTQNKSHTKKVNKITTQDTKRVINAPDLSLEGQEMKEEFNVKAGYGWVKVYIKNDGTKPIKFSVAEGSETGPIVMSGTVEAGKSKTFYNWKFKGSENGAAVGTHVISLNCNEAVMKGRATVRIGTSKSELED